MQESRRANTYYQQTRRPLNNLVVVLALLVFFHVGAAFYGTELLLVAPLYLRKAFYMLGAPAAFVPAIPVVLVLLAQHLLHRDKWEVQPHAVAGMIGESIIWTIPLIALSYVTGRIMAATGAAGHDTLLRSILIAAGAGVYEEFLFRMMAISLLLLLLVDVCGLKKDPMTVLAVLAAAVLFGLCHFDVLGGAYKFQWRQFIFLSVAGILWGALFLFRGFAIAAGSHMVWDIFAFVAFSEPTQGG